MGSRPDARSWAIRGFSAVGGAGVTFWAGGVLVSCGWKGRDGNGGGGVGLLWFAVARINSARLLELRKEGVADGGGA